VTLEILKLIIALIVRFGYSAFTVPPCEISRIDQGGFVKEGIYADASGYQCELDSEDIRLNSDTIMDGSDTYLPDATLAPCDLGRIEVLCHDRTCTAAL